MQNSSISISRMPRGSRRTASTWELWTRIDSPFTERTVVARSDNSSTTPSSLNGSMMIRSPTAYQPSNSMKAPVRISVRKRWPAKPISTTSSEAPATVVTLPPPASAWNTTTASIRIIT